MTGEQLYQRMQAALSEWLAPCPPDERHRHKGALIRDFCNAVAAHAPYDLAQDFEEAMKRHGY